MSTFLALKALHEEGVPKKTMARRLGIDVRTVRSWLHKIEAGASSPSMSERPGKLDEHRALISELVDRGCSAVQIHRHLSGLVGFDASYETVKRLVRRLSSKPKACYQRMNFEPGSEAQIDFGEVAAIEIDGRRRRRWIFCMTLCFSRYAYYELVFDQKVPTFLGAIRRGFEFFGGAPERIKPDNLRSAVLINALGERVYQRDFFELCRHYNTVPDAARPRTATDKGRVERDIRYAKGSFFRGRVTATAEVEAADLARWRDGVANQRQHGTTRRAPAALFEIERQALRPLPDDPFELSDWGRYRVRKDCHVHVARNYYSVPHRFVGEYVDVRVREDEVAVFAEEVVVARHSRLRGEGQSSTDPQHYPESRRTPTQEIHRQRVMKVRAAGPETSRFLARIRTGAHVLRDQLLRMAKLIDDYGDEAVELACRRALHFEAVDSAMRLQRILERGLESEPLPCERAREADCHPGFARSLREYETLLEMEAQA